MNASLSDSLPTQPSAPASPPVTRRRFLRSAATTASFLFLADSRSVRGAPANEKMNIALIGCGGRGEWFVQTVPPSQNMVAMCDVNEKRAANSFQKLPGVPKFKDFRQMLESRTDQIDGVIIAAPDSIHAPATLMALRMKKHVFCEKPLTQTLHEARLVRAAAAAAPVATQLGNQGTSSEAFRRAVELVRAGVLGDITEIHAWNEGGGASKPQLPSGTQEPPESLDWDLWLGPAPARPYHQGWMQWHAWRQFATGQLGNWASHTMNLPFMALGLDTLWDAPAPGTASSPIRVTAECERLNPHSFPRWEIITWDFPARLKSPPVKVNWYNGHSIPRGREAIEKLLGRQLDWGDAGARKWNDYAGCLLIGSKGMLHATGHNMSFSLLPAGAEFNAEKSLPRARSHEHEWYEACRGGRAALSNFEYGGRLAEFTLLGNIATLHPGVAVKYDPVAGKLVEPADAAPAFTKTYREGWAL